MRGPACWDTLSHDPHRSKLWTIQGHIHRRCTPEATCISPFALKLWGKCNTADNDCAVFLERERSAFEGAGYTAVQPVGSNALLGYAYPATDVDLPSDDTFPDALELVIGMRTDAAV